MAENIDGNVRNRWIGTVEGNYRSQRLEVGMGKLKKTVVLEFRKAGENYYCQMPS